MWAANMNNKNCTQNKPMNEKYQGKKGLLKWTAKINVGICSIIFASLWGFFCFVLFFLQASEPPVRRTIFYNIKHFFIKICNSTLCLDIPWMSTALI